MVIIRGWKQHSTSDWMAGAFCVALVVWVMSRTLTSVPGADLGATARWSFVLFWLGTTGGALARLFGPRFEGLARRARDFSLAYASAHLVHLAIVVRIVYLEPAQHTFELLLFGPAVFWTYLLAGISLARLQTRLHPTLWRIVRTVGTEYIALAFLIDFAKNPFGDGLFKVIYYLPFMAFAAASPLLRLAAFVKRSSDKKRAFAGSAS